MNNYVLKQFMLFNILILFSSHLFAIDASQVSKDRQSTTGLYFTSQEAFEHMAKNAISTLFVDIRDPAEIFTVGMPLVVDKNVVFKWIDPKKWNDDKSTFGFKNNPKFTKKMVKALKAKELTKSDTIILICGSGKRAAKAASSLKKSGFSKVYSVVDGYQTWQKSKLPWSRKLDKRKVLVR